MTSFTVLDQNSVFVPMTTTDLILAAENWCCKYIGRPRVEWDLGYANNSNYNYDVIFLL